MNFLNTLNGYIYTTIEFSTYNRFQHCYNMKSQLHTKHDTSQARKLALFKLIRHCVYCIEKIEWTYQWKSDSIVWIGPAVHIFTSSLLWATIAFIFCRFIQWNFRRRCLQSAYCKQTLLQRFKMYCLTRLQTFKIIRIKWMNERASCMWTTEIVCHYIYIVFFSKNFKAKLFLFYSIFCYFNVFHSAFQF